MSTIIRITSKHHGFRRGGIAHPAAPTDYPVEQFSEEQLAQIMHEPTLSFVLVEVEDQPPPEPKKPAAKGKAK